MKIKITVPVIVVVLLVALIGTQAFAQENASAQDDDRYKYVVKRGDTMWSLASRFLDNPFNWPQIWQQNPHIEDPHWIYPGDILMIIPEAVKKQRKIDGLPVERVGGGQVEEAAAVEEGASEFDFNTSTIKKDRVIYTSAQAMGFMSPKIIDTSAVITTAPEIKVDYAAWDHVYISSGKNEGVNMGDKFTIFRPIKPIRHPVSKRKMGYLIKTVGALKIVKLEDESARSEIYKSNEPAKMGDHLTPLIELPVEVMYTDSDPRYHDNPLQAYIICDKNDSKNFSTNQIVYIDVGTLKGVKAGNLFDIYLPRQKVYDPEMGKKVWLPDEVVGRLVVLIADENASTALIIDGDREFAPGELIRSRRFTGPE